ncbi:uncharacterized protein C2845_PM03G30110 [Panicum miliaceum]|uniref:Transposase n=1 Tax=Panicum miliaceum TaxID=4540 RepID=A0A3L6T955_PANMI|nr:uncharacterized protein C2845_PM03G30110 [Panicum miliaceum]
MIHPNSVHSQPKFIDMRNIMHMDEKWYNSTKKNKTMYLHPDEDDPLRTVQNKNCIHKCMFLSLLALPRYDAQGKCYFDGKIGIFPFVRKEPAKRKSPNRSRGTLITKTINVKRETSKAFLISKVLPAIARCWPREDAGETIWIQQDNAPSHIRHDDPDFALAVAQTGLDIRLMNQPPNSPDMNILDLGFFSSLQSKAYLRNSKNIDELVSNVVKEYNDYVQTW